MTKLLVTLISALVLFALPASAFAAVAFTVEQHASAGSGTTVTDAFNFSGAGTNVTVACFLGSGDSTHDVHATAATWDNVAMTQLGTTNNGSPSAVNGTLNAWVLAGAHAVNGNLVTTWNSSVTAFGALTSCISYSGTATTNPTDVTNPASKTGNFSVNITPSVAASAVVFFSNYGCLSTDVTGGTTFRENGIGCLADIVPATGAQTPGENTAAGSNQAVAMAIAIAPFVASTPVSTPSTVTFFGF